ncbi:hypothetical protein KP509_29G034100 [Ceratopteris richardii]|uniref:Uncharacterized protein n=1 Tax=Ceratopteris richardii TaxID=49495 RepID=A0A8T2R7L5_CERRI|nr:hypothetical protein KP509_29G034100 [Ceratopteris richardii]
MQTKNFFPSTTCNKKAFSNQNVFNPKLGLDSLVITPISQASAKQRPVRVGRTGLKKCYCLYVKNAIKMKCYQQMCLRSRGFYCKA